jgi:hypothetical protein
MHRIAGAMLVLVLGMTVMATKDDAIHGSSVRLGIHHRRRRDCK